MDFTEAQAAVLKEIRSEEPDNGIHAAWIRAKEEAAERMTEASYAAIIRRGEKDTWDQDYQVACMIRRKGVVSVPQPAQEPEPEPEPEPERNPAAQVIQKYMTDGWVE